MRFFLLFRSLTLRIWKDLTRSTSIFRPDTTHIALRVQTPRSKPHTAWNLLLSPATKVSNKFSMAHKKNYLLPDFPPCVQNRGNALIHIFHRDRESGSQIFLLLIFFDHRGDWRKVILGTWNFDKTTLGGAFLEYGVFSHDSGSCGSGRGGARPAEDFRVELLGARNVDDGNFNP